LYFADPLLKILGLLCNSQCVSSGSTGSDNTKTSRETNHPDNTSDSHSNKQTPLDLQFALQSSTALPTYVDFKCVTMNINGISEEKWKYFLSLPVIKIYVRNYLTEHHLSLIDVALITS